MPLLKNRLMIDSVDIVRMKQAEALENTYFTVLEKLKEPHYARIVFGIPAVLLLLFALSYYFNFGWQLPIALIGAYLVVKGFGVEDSILQSFRGLGFSIDRLSFIFYIVSIIFFMIGLLLGYGSYATSISQHNSQLVGRRPVRRGLPDNAAGEPDALPGGQDNRPRDQEAALQGHSPGHVRRILDRGDCAAIPHRLVAHRADILLAVPGA